MLNVFIAWNSTVLTGVFLQAIDYQDICLNSLYIYISGAK
jgi:hypothetical protein